MANIFNLQDLDDNFSEKLNLDDLYEKKRETDLRKLETFNKILARAHTQIKIASRQNIDLQFCTFIVPEIMIGVPKYDSGMCIAYIIDKLKSNGFNIKYIHPNMLFISWNHWIPSYVRNEIKHKTGKEIDSYGNYIKQKQKQENDDDDNMNKLILNLNKDGNNKNNVKKVYNSIKDYTPSGIYKNELFDKINNKISKE